MIQQRNDNVRTADALHRYAENLLAGDQVKRAYGKRSKKRGLQILQPPLFILPLFQVKPRASLSCAASFSAAMRWPQRSG